VAGCGQQKTSTINKEQGFRDDTRGMGVTWTAFSITLLGRI
jgi:hypothetical protein